MDLAHGNRRELCAFADCADLGAALGRLTDWGAGAVVVHLGREGAGYWKDGQWVVEPPELATSVVNPTGTGDVLSICMILLQSDAELPIRQKLRLANGVVREFMEGRLNLIPGL